MLQGEDLPAAEENTLGNIAQMDSPFPAETWGDIVQMGYSPCQDFPTMETPPGNILGDIAQMDSPFPADTSGDIAQMEYSLFQDFSTTEMPSDTPTPFASPIANKKRVAKGGPFWCTRVGCTRMTPFDQKSNMELHVEHVHDKKKSKCPVCEKFITSYNLSAHIDRRHEGKKIHCDTCDKDLAGDMARHCRTPSHRRNKGE